MIKNFLKIATRHLWRNRLYSFINIVGLTLAMTCVFLAILYVKDETSYDHFHKMASQLYRLTTTIMNPRDGSKERVGTTGQVQGPAFKAAIPEIIEYIRVLGMDGINVINGTKSIEVKNLYADINFFTLFSFPLVSGNPKTVLMNPYSVVLSQSVAFKLFGTTDVVGKILKLEEGRGIEPLTITGVAKDVPSNSSIQFDMVAPFSYFQSMFLDKSWLNQYLTTFILLHHGANPKLVDQKILKVFETKVKEEIITSKTGSSQFIFELLPFTDIHLHPLSLNSSGTADEERGLSETSSLTYSYILLGIVSFILLMSCVNFINLNMAGSMKRSKEIGIRKIVGSSRRQIILQFLGEATLLCLISFISAVLLSQALLPIFNQLASKKISLINLADFNLFIYGTLVVVVCVAVAGLYPAIVLSLFNPAEVLYNKLKLRGKNLFSKWLIVLQFTLAMGLVIATIVYYRQMNFISTTDPGYNPSDIVKIHLPPQRVDQKMVDLFRSELLNDPAIRKVAAGDGPGLQALTANGRVLNAKKFRIDEYYLPTLEIALIEGRNFSKTYGTDSINGAIVNEAFVRAAGWDHPIGQHIRVSDAKKSMTVTGVVKDYHYGSMKEKIKPQLFTMGNSETILIKIQRGKIPQVLSDIERTYKNIIPDHYYQFTFLESENAGLYLEDKRWQRIISLATLLAILICCLGLFGLAHFDAQQRTKEIGVRKVLGASVKNIVALLSTDFIKLVLLSFLIASPLAWWIMSKWLLAFAYRIALSWWIFVFVGFSAIMIALITVSFQALKAARANPVKSLRAD